MYQNNMNVFQINQYMLKGNIFSLNFSCFIADTQFTNSPGDIENGCSGGTSSMYFNWTYSTLTSVLTVEWKKDGSAIARESVGISQPFTPVAAYVGRLTKISNAQISLGSLSIADSGIYTCEVTYTSGNTHISNSTEVNVYGKSF